LVPVLLAFYIQGVLKFKCKIPGPKGNSVVKSAVNKTKEAQPVSAC